MPTKCFVRCLLLLLSASLLFSACKKDEAPVPSNPTQVVHEYKIAVIYPFPEFHSDGDIEGVVNWVVQNIKSAQQDFDTAISISVEWYDENTVDLQQLGNDLRLRPDIMAVVGPMYSGDVDIIADRLKGTRKTLIAPCATSGELVRTYGSKKFYWTLAESDITQCEVLLTRAKSLGAKNVSLLASRDSYGETFIDWFAFQAVELGLNVTDIFTCDPGAEDVESVVQEAFNTEKDFIICAMSSIRDIKKVLGVYNSVIYNWDEFPYVLFSDVAHDPNLVDFNAQSEYMEGVTISADPESAFEIGYRVHFGSTFTTNEPHYYDAVMLAAFAICGVDCHRYDNMYDAMCDIVSTSNPDGTSRSGLLAWTDNGMGDEMLAMRSGADLYNIRGATGNLDFDSKILTCVVHSVYAHWMVYQQCYITLNYLSSSGSHRTEASLAAWNWVASVTQDFSGPGTYGTYSALENNWALLVAGSETWKNYRHQADVLNMYNILKKNGYDDDHIILVMKDDIVNNPESPFPGEVRRYDDVNLYVDVHLDYNLDQLTADDFEKILSGQRSERLPHVIDATSSDNVLVFWSGHGEPGSLLLGERGEENGLTTERMASLLNTMKSRNCYRKMLWLIETCYSASVASAAEGEQIPGVLMITAAGPFETSKASQKIDGVYRSNRFSELLTEVFSTNLDITYRNLYYELTKQTMGSHVTMLNASRFDNVFTTTPREFIQFHTQQN